MTADDWLPTGRCEGHCCRMITLSATPEEIAIMEAGNRHIARVDECARLEGRAFYVSPNVASCHDATFVTQHFVLVRNSYRDGFTGAQTWQRSSLGARPMPQYRCTAWTGRDCGRYDERPDLCRRYGSHERQCEVPGCRLRWRYRPARDAWEDDGGAPDLARD